MSATIPVSYRLVVRLCGFVACAFAVALAAQWLSLSFGWDPLIDRESVERRTARIAGPLREGPAMLAAVGVAIVGLACLAAWVLSTRHPTRDATFRVGSRRNGLRVDRASLAASLERRLETIDRRVDVSVDVSRRGRIDMRLVTPDTSATGAVAEHTSALTRVLDERGLPCRVRSVDVVDVRRLKTRHRVR